MKLKTFSNAKKVNWKLKNGKELKEAEMIYKNIEINYITNRSESDSFQLKKIKKSLG